MSRGKASGYTLDKHDARIVLGMQARGDRDHDIAAWFGVNQGRVAEAKDGKYGTLEAAPKEELPPKGPPGIKGRRLREALDGVLSSLEDNDEETAVAKLKEAAAGYDANEA